MIRKIATAAAAAAAALLLAAPAATAAPVDEYAGVGSDTTQDVMRALTEEYSLDNPDYLWTSIDANSTTQSIQDIGTCPGVTYSSSNPAPNGSSAGINALLADTNNCIDFARSSRPLKAGTEQTSLTAVRLGGDSVSWSALPQASGGKAPANLTLENVRKIYKCEVTDWSQVGGTSGSIVRYYPQGGSGTRDFFTGSVLGFDPTDLQTGSCTTAPTIIQENRGNQIDVNDTENAIFPYSKAAWTAQSNSGLTGVPDSRDGLVLGTIDGKAAGSTSFVGNRDVFNVYKNATAAPELIAFLNWAATQNSIKALYGFTA
ncbi:MAG TPA: substrate-binding domain-containing protein [Yinghuangia sp.]|uniref:substrate-binding domain-containing protein n=1 Tax=Yinghuangia sp. YIM S10712 TaxID=3436930 RepID=UPI002C69DA6C|nr:substrate-binding domain-containing protein [Yinghuangia sp.]